MQIIVRTGELKIEGRYHQPGDIVDVTSETAKAMVANGTARFLTPDDGVAVFPSTDQIDQLSDALKRAEEQNETLRLALAEAHKEIEELQQLKGGSEELVVEKEEEVAEAVASPKAAATKKK